MKQAKEQWTPSMNEKPNIKMHAVPVHFYSRNVLFPPSHQGIIDSLVLQKFTKKVFLRASPKYLVNDLKLPNGTLF